MCPSGQWKLKFDSKPRKKYFAKLNGDLVSVPALYHPNYPLAMTLDTDLKALVISSQHFYFHSSKSYSHGGDRGVVEIRKTHDLEI